MNLIFPVSKKDGRLPVISDGWHMRSSGKFHYGVDIMFKRLPNEPIQKPWSTKNYIIFPNTAILAAHDGIVKTAERIGTGGFVHLVGSGVETQYMHLVDIMVKPGQHVKAGTVLGTPGDNPKDSGDPAHLHFELYVNGDRVDPAPFLKNARYITKMILGLGLLVIGGLGVYLLVNKGFKW